MLVLFDDWNSFFRNRVVPWRMAMAEKTRAQLERELLPSFMRRQRWYAAKTATLERIQIVDHAQLKAGNEEWLLALAEASGGVGAERYFVPLAIAFEDHNEERTRALAAVAVAKVRQQAAMGVLADAMADESFCRALVEGIGAGWSLPTEGGTIRFKPSASCASVVGDSLLGVTPVRRLTASSNSISLLGDRLFLKAYRRLLAGENPELEMGRFLTDVAGFKHSVAVAGCVEYVAADGSVSTLALLQAQITNQGDAWMFTVDQLARILESHGKRAETSPDEMAALIDRMQILARRVAELHIALARRTGNAAFDPEPITPADVQHWAATVRDECRRTFEQVAQRQSGWAAPLARLADLTAGAMPQLLARIDTVRQTTPAGLKTRLHGDLHLGQALITRDDFVLINFEGEPTRPLDQRRAKHCALRDVAGMLRSFDHARHTALHRSARTAGELERLAPVAHEWARRAREAFLRSYRQVAIEGHLYGGDSAFEQSLVLLDLFELEKALYEMRYEMDNRPDWVGVSLAGVAAMAGVAESP